MAIQTDVKQEVQSETSLVEPGKFRVILHNDEKTTFDFVIYVLEFIFNKSSTEALELTKYIHSNGSATAGIYTHQIAETKAEETIELAKINAYPLKATVEEV